MVELIGTMSEIDIQRMIEIKTHLDLFGWLDNLWLVVGIVGCVWLVAIILSLLIIVFANRNLDTDVAAFVIMMLIGVALMVTIGLPGFAWDIHVQTMEFDVLCDTYRSIYGGLPWE